MTTVLLIGLGNPGVIYENNRHNVGFKIIDTIAKEYVVGGFRKMASMAETASSNVGDFRIILAKPQTFMNLSGKAVRVLADFYKIPPENMCIFHDDIDLAFSQIKIKKGGGNGGHNGLKSIDSAIGPNYWRVRIGVGRPLYKSMVSDYVLKNFDNDQEKTINSIADDMAKNILTLLERMQKT
ncbi:MAG: aminoacyl-tRNA hydrolase [Holosporaceae bacterium]|jgi:PTH1 family peptidyl-tRNA hydrolase|nr:aminoacyl-tRNA hydrolase [Holosporaceae bacterium]